MLTSLDTQQLQNEHATLINPDSISTRTGDILSNQKQNPNQHFDLIANHIRNIISNLTNIITFDQATQKSSDLNKYVQGLQYSLADFKVILKLIDYQQKAGNLSLDGINGQLYELFDEVANNVTTFIDDNLVQYFEERETQIQRAYDARLAWFDSFLQNTTISRTDSYSRTDTAANTVKHELHEIIPESEIDETIYLIASNVIKVTTDYCMNHDTDPPAEIKFTIPITIQSQRSSNILVQWSNSSDAKIAAIIDIARQSLMGITNTLAQKIPAYFASSESPHKNKDFNLNIELKLNFKTGIPQVKNAAESN